MSAYTPEIPLGKYNIFTAVVLARNPGGEFGGYRPHHFITPVGVHCGFCRQVPRDPHRVACGHIFCQECLFANIIQPRQPCSQCHAPVTRDDCVLDVHLARRIASSSISCPYSEKCQWGGHLSHLAPHFSECPHVAPVLRSWMQSVQFHISGVAEESGRLERRVDRLTDLAKQMKGRCGAAEYEYDKQLGWIGNQMEYLHRDVLNTSPAKKTPPPQRFDPTAPLDFPSLNISEDDMTESLRIDLNRMNLQAPPRQVEADLNAPPKRNVHFSVYEDHVRDTQGDTHLEFETSGDMYMFHHDPFDSLPTGEFQLRPEPKLCLNCNQYNAPTSNRCDFCGRVI